MFGRVEGPFVLALNSLPFLALLGAAVLVFYLSPGRYRWLAVTLASVLFYLTWASPIALLGVFALVLLAYFCAVGMGRYPRYRLILSTVGVVGSLGTLALLKYFGFFLTESMSLLHALGLTSSGEAPTFDLVLPIGYSFITFSVTSYIVDVYRGKQQPARLTDLTVFVIFFPKLLAGPIERATHFLPQWRERVRFDSAKAVMGMQLILWGLFKKVVIADRLAPFVNAAYETPAFSTPFDLLIGTYFYAFQIYCDFSGYTDIAIGAIMLFGVVLAPNFHHPYLSRSVPEFWNSRWHISLGKWFRDYLYIPLGGSRVSRLRTYLNVMVVFVVSGIWHAGMIGTSLGWSFAIWGVINGFYVVLWSAFSTAWQWVTKRLPQLRALDTFPGVYTIQAVLTFHLITFSWIFFRASSLSDAWTVVTKIYTNLGSLPMLARFYDFSSFDFRLSLLLILLLLLIELLTDRMSLVERIMSAPRGVRWGFAYVAVVALVILGKWGTPTFIYMQF